VVRVVAGPGFAQPYGPAQDLCGNASARLQGLLSTWLRRCDFCWTRTGRTAITLATASGARSR